MKRTVCASAIIVWFAAWPFHTAPVNPPGLRPAPPDDEAQPFVTITGIDAAAFPEIKVTIYGENLGIDLGELPVTLREDIRRNGLRKTLLQEIGVQTAFALDASLIPATTFLAQATVVARGLMSFARPLKH